MTSALTSIVLKIVERCNLNCSYCYLYNHEDQSWRERPRFISDEILDATLRAIGDYCVQRPHHQMTLVLHGGEPLLIGKRRFQEICGRARSSLGESLAQLTVQTNGTLVDVEWTALFHEQAVTVGVSLDGPPVLHDNVRVTHSGLGSYAQTVRGLKCLQEANLNPGVLCVIDPGADGLRVFDHFKDLGITNINFLLPDVSHDNKSRLYGKRGEHPVADYLIPVFDSWFDTDDPRIRIRLFWGLLRMLMGGIGETDAFGNPTMRYVVVETDGSIEPLDALRVCEHGITKMGLNVMKHGFDDLSEGFPLLHRLVHEGIPLPTGCRNCSEREICGGGYLPNRYSKIRGFDNPSVWCADILQLLAHMRSRIPPEVIVDSPARSTVLRERRR